MWFKWVLIVMLVLGAASNAAMVGQEREPVTPGYACFYVLWSALFIFGVLHYWR
jgi:hypothetical protein